MNEMERDLQEAMAAQANDAEPQDEAEALARIQGRLAMNRRRWISLAGAAAAIFLVAGALVLLTRGDDKQQVNLSTDSSASPTSTSTSTSIATTTTVASVTTPSSTPSSEAVPTTDTVPPTTTTLPATFPHVWPLDQASGFSSPEEAAHSFFADYLGMTEEQLGQTTAGADGPTAQVEGFPRGPGSSRTVVDLVHTANGWVVVGARADEIVVDDPLPFGGVSHPMHVSGQSVAFEAQLGIELRLLGSGTVAATGTAMGGSTDMQPFDTTIDPPPGDAPLALLVFEGDASGAQTYSKVTVVVLGTGQTSRDTALDGF